MNGKVKKAFPDVVPFQTGLKKLAANGVHQSLNVSPPKQSGQLPGIPKQDLHPGTMMNIPIGEITSFENNPRTVHDPEYYEAIKASIRAKGVEQPVHITKRPGANCYVLSKGGNTRLQIVTELHQETGEDRFAFLPCIYQRYVSETDLLISHMIENEQRAEMCFWDKAKSYAVLRDELCNQENISLRELAATFASNGLEASYSRLGIMLFAYDHLSVLASLTLHLSNPKTTDIRKVYNKYQQLSASLNKPLGFFDQLWHDTLSDWAGQHVDDAQLNHLQLIDDIESRLQPVFGVTQPPETPDAETAPLSAAVAERPASPARTGRQPVAPVLNAPVQQVEAEPEPDEEDLAGTADQVFTLEEANSPAVPETDMVALTVRIHTLVQSLLAEFGLDSAFALNSHFKFGCYIEVPDFESIVKPVDIANPPPFVIDYLHPQAGFMWWFLCDLCGQRPDSYNYDDSPVYQLPESSAFRQYVSDDALWYQLTASLIGDPPTGAGYLIDWLTEPDSSLQAALRALLDAVHQFRRLSKESLS